VDDQVTRLPKRKPVAMRTARAVKVIGVPLTDARLPTFSPALRLTFEQRPGEFAVTPPSYRFDIEIEEDLIEEVARVYGFENIPTLPPVAAQAVRIAPENLRSLFTSCAIVWPTWITRKWSTSALSKKPGNRTSPTTAIRSNDESDREPDERDALDPDRQPGRQRQVQPQPQGTRVRAFELAAVYLRADTRETVP
jgi:hypothetical protein